MTRIVCVALLAFVAPQLAAAQDGSAPDRPMKGAPTVYVMDVAGRETIGKIVRWSPSEIVLQAGPATKTFAMGDVARVDLRGDSLKNGAWIGAGVGAVLGVLVGGFGDCTDCGAGTGVAIALTSIGFYTAVGTAIDAMIAGRTPLWRAGSPTSARRGLTVRVMPERRGASIGWRF